MLARTASFCHGRAGHFDMFDQASKNHKIVKSENSELSEIEFSVNSHTKLLSLCHNGAKHRGLRCAMRTAYQNPCLTLSVASAYQLPSGTHFILGSDFHTRAQGAKRTRLEPIINFSFDIFIVTRGESRVAGESRKSCALGCGRALLWNALPVARRALGVRWIKGFGLSSSVKKSLSRKFFFFKFRKTLDNTLSALHLIADILFSKI